MAGEQHPRAAVVNRLAHEMAKSLVKHPLLLADGLLDEARRFFLTTQLSGARDETAIAQLGTPGEAVGLGGHYIGLSIEEMLKVDSLIRLGLWVAHFAAMPETRCGAGFASSLEEARRYDNPPDRGAGKPN